MDTFADKTSRGLSGEVDWRTADADVIATDPGGTVSSPHETEGRAIVTAAFEGVSGTAVVVCDPNPVE